jgi:hypothetical protein
MNTPAIVSAADGQFLAGLIIGVFVGLLLGPLLRSWLAWREWVDASKEADLTERFLARWEDEDSRSDERLSEDEGQASGRAIPSQQGPAAPARQHQRTPNGESLPA